MQVANIRGVAALAPGNRSRSAQRNGQGPCYKARLQAVPVGDAAHAEAAEPGLEVARPHELLRMLTALEADLAASSAQLEASQASDATEQATLESVQAELSTVTQALTTAKATQEADKKEDNEAWMRSMRLAQQAVQMKALIAERDAEVADLQRQLAEFDEAKEELPAYAYVGGGVDEEGRERVAQLERQLSLELQGRMVAAPAPKPALTPLRKPAATKPRLDRLLRSVTFPGVLVLAAVSGAADVVTAAWGVVRPKA